MLKVTLCQQENSIEIKCIAKPKDSRNIIRFNRPSGFLLFIITLLYHNFFWTPFQSQEFKRDIMVKMLSGNHHAWIQHILDKNLCKHLIRRALILTVYFTTTRNLHYQQIDRSGAKSYVLGIDSAKLVGIHREFKHGTMGAMNNYIVQWFWI